MNLESHTSEQLHEQTTPSIVESFSQSQLTTIQKKWIILDPKERETCANHLKAIETSSDNTNQAYIKDIINQLLPLLKPEEQQLLPSILKNIRKESKNIITTQKDIPGYINNLLWKTKTENNIINVVNNEVQSTTSSDTISDEEMERIEDKKKLLVQKTAEAETTTQIDQQLKAEIQNLSKTIQWFYEKTDTIQESERKPQKSSILEKLNKQELLAKDWSKKSMLITLQQAFWYNFQPDTILPDWTKKTNYEAWMMNDTIDNQITILLYNYARLQDKIKQSQQPNSKVKVTEQEKQQAQEFGTMLESLWVNSDELYESLDIHYQIPKENNTPNLIRNKGIDISSGSEVWNTKDTPTKETSLWTISESFEKMDSEDMHVSPLFVDQFNNPKPWFDDASLLKAFPLPTGIQLQDFDINNPELLLVIDRILHNPQSHPLIAASTQDSEKIKNAQKNIIKKYIFDANPTLKTIPDEIRMTLLPDHIREKVMQKSPEERKKFIKTREQELGAINTQLICY